MSGFIEEKVTVNNINIAYQIHGDKLKGRGVIVLRVCKSSRVSLIENLNQVLESEKRRS